MVGLPNRVRRRLDGRQHSLEPRVGELVAGIHLAGQQVLDQLVAIVTHGALRIEVGSRRMRVKFGKEILTPFGRLVTQQRHERSARQSAHRLRLGNRQQRGHQVDGRDQFLANLTGLGSIRPADDQRDTDAPFVGSPLAAQEVGSVVAKVDDQRVVRLARPLQRRQQIANQRIEAAHAVVVIGNRFAHRRRIDAEIGKRFDVVRLQRILGQAVDLLEPWAVRVGIVDAQKERPIVGVEIRLGILGIIPEVLAGEIGGGYLVHIEGKRLFGIDVQLADNPGAVAGRLQAARDIRRVLAIHAEVPGGQADLAVLVRIETGQVGGTRLAATGLGNKGAIESHSLGGKPIQIRRPGVGIAVATQFRPVVFGDDQQNVRPRGQASASCKPIVVSRTTANSIWEYFIVTLLFQTGEVNVLLWSVGRITIRAGLQRLVHHGAQLLAQFPVGGVAEDVLPFDEKRPLWNGASVGTVVVKLFFEDFSRRPPDPARVAVGRRTDRVTHHLRQGRLEGTSELAQHERASFVPGIVQDGNQTLAVQIGSRRETGQFDDRRIDVNVFDHRVRRDTRLRAYPESGTSAAIACPLRSSYPCTNDRPHRASSHGRPRRRRSCSLPNQVAREHQAVFPPGHPHS